MPVLRIICESPTEVAEMYYRVPEGIAEKEQIKFAEGVFFDWANFGCSLIDENDVPDHAEIEEY